MFTEEFIIKACEHARKKDLANSAKEALLNLGINNKGVTTDLNNVVAAADAYNMLAVNYMLSFVPKEILTAIKFQSAYGAFTIYKNIMGLHAVIILRGEDTDLRLKFDNDDKCLYTDLLTNKHDKLYALVSQYISKSPIEFSSWIYTK